MHAFYSIVTNSAAYNNTYISLLWLFSIDTNIVCMLSFKNLNAWKYSCNFERMPTKWPDPLQICNDMLLQTFLHKTCSGQVFYRVPTVHIYEKGQIIPSIFFWKYSALHSSSAALSVFALGGLFQSNGQCLERDRNWTILLPIPFLLSPSFLQHLGASLPCHIDLGTCFAEIFWGRGPQN